MSPRRQQPLTIEHALLGLLREQPLHGYDLYQRLLAPGALGCVWPLKQSQFYALLSKLEQVGYLRVCQEQASSYPPRKMLHLTSAGAAAFAAWQAAPTSYESDCDAEVQRDLLARLFFARREGSSAVRVLLAEQCEANQARRDELVHTLQSLPAHSYEYLVLQWRLRQLAALQEWLDTWAAPQTLTPLVSYPIAALSDSPQHALAERFVAFVCSPAGQQVLEQHGLLSACSSTAAAPTLAASSGAASSGQVLSVFAAASLTEAFQALGQAFGAAHPGVQVACTFAGSHALARQLVQGVAADVFASAHRTPMDMVVQAGRVQPGSQRICAHNRLAVATSHSNPAHLLSLGDLAQPGRRLVFGSDGTAIGHYALDLLEQVEQVGSLGDYGRLAVLQNVVCYEDTPRAVLARIIAGDADAGIVFVSDCHSAAGQVASPIIYPAPLTWGSS
jgi:molybdate transport system substrate-binding protein